MDSGKIPDKIINKTHSKSSRTSDKPNTSNTEPLSNTVGKLSRAKSRRLRKKQASERSVKTSNILIKQNNSELSQGLEKESSVLDNTVSVNINNLKCVNIISAKTHEDRQSIEVNKVITNNSLSNKMDPKSNNEQKSREEIKAEREAKKIAKQQAKNKKTNVGDVASKVQVLTKELKKTVMTEPVKTNVGCETKPFVPNTDEVDRFAAHMEMPVTGQVKPEKTKAELRAERRAKQEAQRAAKSQNIASANTNETKVVNVKVPPKEKIVKVTETTIITKKKVIKQPQTQHKVKLFNHLYSERESMNFMNSSLIHPAVVRLGEQYKKGIIAGSNARCIAFLNTLKIVISDYVTPPQREFSRELESSLKPCIDYLHQCRPVSVSMTNALRFVKRQISQLPPNIGDSDAKLKLQEAIDTYYIEQICTAAKAISSFVQNKIMDGDVILTFGCSSLIQQIFEDAMKNRIDFRVVVVDGRPSLEGREMLRRLVDYGIKCSYIFINAVSFIMGEVTKVLLGAHALLANGYVMSRVGTAQIAMVAQSFNVPVLVCCETHKFIERVQTDSFVYNEIGNPESLVSPSKAGPLQGWIDIPTLSPLNLRYDVTPPELVTAVVTELAILPCTSVPVILRIRPTEIVC